MKFSDYMLKVIVFYNKMFLPVIANFIVWFLLDTFVGFEDKFLYQSGFCISSLVWILSIFLVEIKNDCRKST